MDWEEIEGILQKHSGYEGLHKDNFEMVAREIADLDINKGEGWKKEKKQ